MKQQEAGDGFDVRSLAVTYRESHVLSEHTHPWGQLVYARSGLLNVETEQQIWFVPPTRAVWIPPLVAHRLTFRTEVSLRTLYIAVERAGSLQPAVVTLEVSPLLSQLILHIQQLGMLNPRIPAHDHLASVLVDLISSAPSIDIALPQPKDARAGRLATYMRLHPADRRSLDTLAKAFGASLRTMQRYFAAETGMSVDAWRQKARLIHSVAALSAGVSVTEAAFDCGYEGSSAYVAAFRRHFGVTPGKFEIGSAGVRNPAGDAHGRQPGRGESR